MALQQRCNQISEGYTQLKEQYTAESAQHRAAYEEFRQMVINMSQGETCAANSSWPHNSQPPPPPDPPQPPLY